MAEGVLFNVAGEIIKKLGPEAFKEIGLWWRTKEELEKLKDTVSRIQAVLLDAEKKQTHSNQVRDWLEKLKDAVYDADDLLDDFSTRSLRQGVMTRNIMRKKVRIFFSSSNRLVYGLKIGRKIKKIRERLDEIAEDRIRFQYVEQLVEQHVENREGRQTHSFVLEEEVIGRENDKEEIIKLLLESNVKENISVIPIVGIGGLGKTTLAQLVFNDKRVKTHFELMRWVCVSDDFDLRIITKKILESSTYEKVEMETLKSNLRKEIDGKKYLLVLDDVWNEHQEKWDSLTCLLMGGARGSKILVTTRVKLVAEITSTVPPYHLNGLSESQSWSLLKKTAFKNQGQEPNNPQLVNIGKEIAKKCVGVPLAVKTIGRVLYFKRTELEWLNIMNNELATITQQENGILPILKLSYDHLPSHLKHCFAYCSLFPKDDVINKQTLINLWVAQGFIQASTRDQQLDDVGNEYFMDLVWRSFFQEVQEDQIGDVMSCKMHDLMHDLARSVAGTECTMVNLSTIDVDKSARHVSIGYNINQSWKIPAALLEANKIRTFFLPAQSYGELNESNCNAIVSTYKCLRALDLHGLQLKKVPRSIGKLKHLRNLDLSWNDEIRALPSSISRLHNLQTLNLTDCSNLVGLPSDIRKMVNLRHLLIGGCNGLTGMPKGLGQLTSLRTLSLFVVGKTYRGSGGLRELNGLNNLRGELKISNLKNAMSSESRDAKYLKEKLYLQSLELNWSDDFINNSSDDEVILEDLEPWSDDEVILEGFQPHPNLKQLRVDGFWGVRFSHWLSTLTNIVEIRLVDCKRCKHLPPLDQLPSLMILYLEGLSDLEYMTSEESSTSTTTTTFFPSLKELNLTGCYNLKGWWKNDDDGSSDDSTTTTTTSMAELTSFPCLSKLKILGCPNLISMPLYPSLEEDLYFYDTSSKPLQETMKMKMKMEMMMNSAAPSTSSSSFSSYPLSRLKSLSILLINDLESLPEEGLRNLTSLQYLRIEDCPRLMSLPAEGFRGLTSLRSLELEGCDSLKSMSGVFQHLTALEKLRIEYCEELVSLLEGLQHLTALQSLTINGCLHLSERCSNNMGVDWPKIAHIPNIEINSLCIQKEGRYQLRHE